MTPTSPHRDPELPWWAVDTVLLRFIADLITGELKQLRPGGGGPGFAGPGDSSLDIGRDLGIDSLERLAIASALAEALHVAETGIQDNFLVHTTLGDWVDIARTSLQKFSQRLTFRTSGSTGKPKSCIHTLESLEQEISELAPQFPGCIRIVSAVPSHHIYGFLFTVLLPRRLGIAKTAVLDVRGSTPAAVQPVLRAGDLLIAHPDYWSNVARVGVRFPPGVGGVNSTGPLPEGVGGAVTGLGLTRLNQIYGSSECAGIGWRDGENRNYRLFSYWRRMASQPGVLQRRKPDGRFEEHALQDRLEWFGNDEFLPSGRIDLAVQVGGINVHPARVRDVLLQHPQVVEAAVRLMRPDEGNRLKAFVVVKDEHSDTLGLRAEIAEWASRHLSTPEIPRSLCFGRALPRDAAGKPADWVIEPR